MGSGFAGTPRYARTPERRSYFRSANYIGRSAGRVGRSVQITGSHGRRSRETRLRSCPGSKALRDLSHCGVWSCGHLARCVVRFSRHQFSWWDRNGNMQALSRYRISAVCSNGIRRWSFQACDPPCSASRGARMKLGYARVSTRPRSTGTKFTQPEIRLVVCLLMLYPVRPNAGYAGTDRQWRKVRDGLLGKFAAIDTRFPK